MKKLFSMLCLVLFALAMQAVPARPEWQIVKQKDGSQIEVMLIGDEHFYYFVTRDGIALVSENGNMYYAKTEGNRLVSSSILAHEDNLRTDAEKSVAISADVAAKMRSQGTKKNMGRRLKKIGEADHPDYIGSKKGLIVLVNFSDAQFHNYDEADGGEATRNLFNDIANKEGYTNSQGAIGSVRDYFKAQSNGMFDLTFDIAGPVNLKKPYSYYGKDKSNDDIDWNMRELVVEACNMIDDDIDFTAYDWDGDGEVEEVFFLYAGLGQATGGGSETIWPHMYSLEEWKDELGVGEGAITLDGVKINTYACGNEVYRGDMLMGIGVFCHEFSHCLGLPDMYDTSYGGSYGMSYYDILDRGSYNGPSNIGWVPAGYTAYERKYAGWMDYTTLETDTVVENMKPINEEMNAFAVYNDAYPDEYYILECRNQTGWDRYIPSSGLLIVYVDFDLEQWQQNSVNTVTGEDDHQRMTVFRSANLDIGSEWYAIPDTYPFEDTTGWLSDTSNDELTDTSAPSAYLNHPNTDGSYLMHKPITNIRRNAEDGTVSFNFRNENKQQTAIRDHRTTDTVGMKAMQDADVYTIDGQFAGKYSAAKSLPHGLYLLRSNGGQVVKVAL